MWDYVSEFLDMRVEADYMSIASKWLSRYYKYLPESGVQ
jgi:hypothetical protein